MDYIRRVIFGTLHELWQALKKRAAAVIIAMLLPVIYEFLSLTTCKPLNHVENGSIECVGNWYNNSVGAVCSFSCKKGFQLVGAVKTTCNEEGNWTNGLPSCLKICDQPPKVLHGEVECNGTVVGSACRVKCDKSRKTDGVNLMICGKDGRWLETAPTCVCANPCRTGCATSILEGQIQITDETASFI
ncbi:L-selectin-like isoform X1 [Styela clava]